MAIQSSVVTRDVEKIAEPTGNIYESVVIISKRARQIAVNMKEELNNKLAEFATTVDNLEEVSRTASRSRSLNSMNACLSPPTRRQTNSWKAL
jgi:DNA-directed RNA polymerase subunit K/omega